MNRLRIMLYLTVTLLIIAGSAQALTIRVAPQSFVLSSQGGNLTVHTDYPCGDAEVVLLSVNGTTFIPTTFADNLGNLVAQCGKDDVKEAISDFEGKWTTADVTLTVDGASATETISVKK
jgi:hypothetical protein